MHARYYSSNLGRFLSVDPVGGDIGSSQTWNRYSYVLNNPIRLVDPRGESEDDPEGEDVRRAMRWMPGSVAENLIERVNVFLLALVGSGTMETKRAVEDAATTVGDTAEQAAELIGERTFTLGLDAEFVGGLGGAGFGFGVAADTTLDIGLYGSLSGKYGPGVIADAGLSAGTQPGLLGDMNGYSESVRLSIALRRGVAYSFSASPDGASGGKRGFSLGLAQGQLSLGTPIKGTLLFDGLGAALTYDQTITGVWH